MHEFTVRKMRPGEAETILALWQENVTEATGRLLTVDESARILNALRRYAQATGVFCLLAEQNDKVVGYVTGFVVEHPVSEGLLGHVEEVYVSPSARRRGVGLALVRKAVEVLRELGAHPIRAQVCVDDPVAVGFWDNSGWANEMTLYSLYDFNT